MQQQSAQQVSTPRPAPIKTEAEARQFAENLMEVMTALLAVIELETEEVRAGNVGEAIRLEPKKTELSRRYVSAILQLKASEKYFSLATPDLLAALHRHHDVFRAMLQVNLTVLATAHAVSEGIVRGVNAEIQKRNMPQTYTAGGHRAMPSPRGMVPIAVSRSL